MARTPRAGTPPGMQGVRPGSAAAIAAGYRPPRQQRPTRTPPGYIGQAGTGNPYASFTPPAASVATPTMTAPPPPPPPPAAAPAATPFAPTSSWWLSQFTADPRYMTSAPVLEGQRTQIGQAYGFTIARDAQGRPLYKTAGGAANITQQFDDNGAIVYKDPQGNTYNPSEIQLDIRRVQRGQPGYLEGAFGGTEAASEKRQFGIGDVAAQSGVGRSGMRGQAVLGETAALQAALAGLTGRSAAELAGVDDKYAELYREIYTDLAKKAKDLAAATTPAPAETPAAAPPPSQTAVPGGGTVNPQGQYTPPPSGNTLTSQAFNNTLNEILVASQRGPQPMTRVERIRALRNVYDNYQLTPAQRRRVGAELKKLGFNVA